MSEDMNTPPSPDGDYKVGYKKPPRQYQFKKGQSGNPSGKRREVATGSIIKELEQRVSATQTITEEGRKKKVKFLQLMVRGLVANAANGNIDAFNLLITLQTENPGSKTQKPWRVLPYTDAIASINRDIMDEAFYQAMEAKVEGWRKERLKGDIALGEIIARELKRWGTVKKRNGASYRRRMLDIIIACFQRLAVEGNTRAFKLLHKFVPQQKLDTDSNRVEVLRPTQDELDRFGSKDKSKWPRPRTGVMRAPPAPAPKAPPA